MARRHGWCWVALLAVAFGGCSEGKKYAKASRTSGDSGDTYYSVQDPSEDGAGAPDLGMESPLEAPEPKDEPPAAAAKSAPPSKSGEQELPKKLAYKILDDIPAGRGPSGSLEKLAEKMLASEDESDRDSRRVSVFYATDRKPESDLDGSGRLNAYFSTLISGSVTLLLGLMVCWTSRRVLWGVLTVAGLACTVSFGYSAHLRLQKMERLAEQGNRVYGRDRHESKDGYVLEVGTCEVTIPPDHRVGKLESPSIFRLELSEDPEKHLMLQSITCLEDGPFMDKLKERIAASPGQQTFVFIHGYNVAFDDAVRRTAQIAYDLKFRGAPICYSWPSQGGFAQYTRDEANIAWTVVHLDEFLTRVVEQSGAKSIHLVAHSMGNRAIVQVLERMALRRGTAQPLFGQVIMAAPDVDASEFRDRYAPAVAALARHATLYASSHDQALVASTKVHGYTRAGLSGDHLLVTTGVETVDVSPIDTSLIGHSYYGNHPQMIRDMQALVELGTPASGREWLESIVRAPSRAYWMFRRERPRDEL